jgi:hypothetical protein
MDVFQKNPFSTIQTHLKNKVILNQKENQKEIIKTPPKLIKRDLTKDFKPTITSGKRKRD